MKIILAFIFALFASSAFAASSITYSPFNGCSNVVIQTITADGTYTPTSGMIWVQVEAIGGGGGGGGVITTAAGTQNGAGGGGGGAYVKSILSASIVGAGLAVDIGAGGAGGVAGNNNGSAGSDTTINVTTIVADAGSGGNGAASSAVGSGGVGGTIAGSTGDFESVGGSGTRGYASTALSNIGSSGGGKGGDTVYGYGVPSIINLAGQAGVGYGAGGGGASDFNAGADKAGAAGNSGVAIFTECIR